MNPLRGIGSWILTKIAKQFKPKACENCGRDGCCLYVHAAMRVVEGAGGISIGIRVNHLTPPPKWVCRDCVPVVREQAFEFKRRQVRAYQGDQ